VGRNGSRTRHEDGLREREEERDDDDDDDDAREIVET